MMISVSIGVGADTEAQAEVAVELIIGIDAVDRATDVGDTLFGGEVQKLNPTLRYVVIKTYAEAVTRHLAMQDPAVRYVEEDAEQQWIRLVPDDPFWNDQYGPEQVKAPQVWDESLGSTTKNVCIVDTGVRHSHQEFTGRWLGGNDYVNGDSDPMDDNGHGTHVASTAAGGVNDGIGIAGIGNVGVLGVKVLNSWGSGDYTAIADGIQWCADNQGDVISLSLGGGHAQVMQEAVEYATQQGSLVIAAAGNDGPCSDCISYPAAYPDALAVTCTDVNEAQCSFSSDGPEAALAAPGKSIKAAWHSSDSAYNTIDGTSMSTPHVSGVAALVWSQVPDLTNSELQQLLLDNAYDVGPVGWDEQFGHGIVDALATFTAAGGGDGLPPLPPPIQNTIFTEDFESGAPDWTTSGLWHVDDACSDAPSPSHYLGFHDSGCDYDTGARVTSDASLAVDLRDSTVATIYFDHWFETEPEYWGGLFGDFDVMTVEGRPAGGTWSVLRQWDTSDNNQPSWNRQSVRLDSLAGGLAEVRFSFDSIDADYNDYPGWFIDDVEVTADDIHAPNIPPTAVAGPDQVLSDHDGTGEERAFVSGSASSDLDGIIVDYQWFLDDALVATGKEANFSVPVGEHTVRLQVMDHENATGDDTLEVEVLPNVAPTASFGLQCRNLDCDLDASTSSDSDGTVVDWQWDLGDGTTTTGVTTSYSFPLDGTYTVTLTAVDDGDATDSVTHTFTALAADLVRDDDFAAAAPGWATTGWWHRDDACADPPDPGYLGYHLPVGCAYHALVDESGTASVTVDLSSYPLGRLAVDHWWDTAEVGDLDQMQVQVYSDGGWHVLGSWSAGDPEPAAWRHDLWSLDPYAGDTATLQLRFDSGDRIGQGVPDTTLQGGWLVDHLTVYGDHWVERAPHNEAGMALLPGSLHG